MIPLALFVLGLLGSDDPSPFPARAWEPVATRKPTDVRLPMVRLGPGWKASTIIAVDDLDDLQPLSEPVRAALAPVVAPLRSEGVRALKEYTWTKSTIPVDSISVRVFVFEDPARCRAWWLKKYQGEGWQKFYQVVPSDQFAIVDSTELAKRAVAFGRVVVTSGHAGKGDEHLRTLDAVVAAFRQASP